MVPRWLPLRSGVASAWVLMSTHVSSDGGPAQGDTTAAAGQVPAAGGPLLPFDAALARRSKLWAASALDLDQLFCTTAPPRRVSRPTDRPPLRFSASARTVVVLVVVVVPRAVAACWFA